MNNRTTTILLAVIAVLLVVVAFVFITGSRSTQPAAPTAAAPTATQPSQPAAVGPPTKVPAGMALDKFVSAYYSALLKKDWKTAYAMQPAASKSAMGDVNSFASAQQGYGMTSFKVSSFKNQGSSAVVEVQQDLGTNGIWVSQWTFKKSGSTWIAESKQTGMAPPAK